MKINNLLTGKMGQIVYKATGKIQKYSPEILVVTGVVGVVASTIMACKATTKINDILDEPRETLENVRKGMKDGEINGHEYTKADGKKDATIIYAQTGIKLVKLYAPSVVLGTLSIAGIVMSNNILKKRNIALGAAYAAIDKSFKDYRLRVVERFGEQIDKELKYNIKAVEYKETEIDPETGKEKKVKKTLLVTDPNLTSDYATYFDERSHAFEKVVDKNMFFLHCQEKYFNDILNIKGHVFLNEVLEALDLPVTKAGQIVGWTRDGGDGYINFRITEVDRETYDGGTEPAILLDFNVEGNIWEKM